MNSLVLCCIERAPKNIQTRTTTLHWRSRSRNGGFHYHETVPKQTHHPTSVAINHHSSTLNHSLQSTNLVPSKIVSVNRNITVVVSKDLNNSRISGASDSSFPNYFVGWSKWRRGWCMLISIRKFFLSGRDLVFRRTLLHWAVIFERYEFGT